MNKKKIAIEYQCAKISSKEIIIRNEGYLSIGITPIWIIGANRFTRQTSNHFKVDAFTQHFIHQYTSDFPSVLYYFCPHTLQMMVIQDVVITRNGQAIGKMEIANLRNVSFKDLFLLSRWNHQELYTNWKKEKQRFRLQSGKRVFGKELAWRQWLYVKGTHIEYLPSVIHLPVASQFRMKSNPWDWQSRICLDLLEPLPLNAVLSFSRIAHLLRSHLKPSSLFPLIHSEEHPAREYVQYLVKLGILSPVGTDHYKKLKALSFYSHIEDAVEGDGAFMKHLIEIENKIRA